MARSEGLGRLWVLPHHHRWANRYFSADIGISCHFCARKACMSENGSRPHADTPSVVFRRACAPDAPVLSELGLRTFLETFAAKNRPEDIRVAYALLRRAFSPACVISEFPIEISRFYVSKELHGFGVAQDLMVLAIKTVRDLGGRAAWLGVWEKNARAIAFYRKCGFTVVGSQPFLLGTDLQTDLVMVQEV